MKQYSVLVAAVLGLGGATAYADEPPQPPRTHIDTTVVGSNTSADTPADSNAPSEAATLDNDHGFQAGAPELLKITDKLHLSAKQKAQLNDVIERSDAGAAALIKREHDVKEMIAATTPQNPQYAELIKEQGAESDRWTDNRETFRREVLALLTPAQQTRFEQLQASR